MANSIYFTSAELEQLKQMTTLPSHAAIWNNIVAYADASVGSAPPSEPDQETAGKQDFSMVNGAVKRHIETMAFMYCMTDDPAYANSAIDWMVSVSGWAHWGIPASYWFNDSIIMRGFAFAYSVVKDLMTAADRQAVINSLALRVDELYEHQKVWREAGIRDEGQAHYPFPNHEWGMAAAIGLAGLVLRDDHVEAQVWYDFGVVATQDYLGGAREDKQAGQLTRPLSVVPHAPDFGPEGDGFEGESYGAFTLLLVLPFLAALKTSGVDLFAGNAYLSNAAYYFIYMFYSHEQPGSQYEPKGWLAVEDSENHFGFNQATGAGAPHPEGITWMYLLAHEFNNGYAQTFAEFGADDYTIFAFIWNSPSVNSLPIEDLPLSRWFTAAGYVLWKGGWEGNDLNVLFKSGSSRGHAHQNQNEFMIWNNGDKITGSPGAGEGQTYKHNCLLVRNAESGLMEGQGKEWADSDEQNMVLGTRGKIEEVAETPYYRYARGNAVDVYKPANRRFSAYGRPFTSYPYNGILDKWLRHIILMKDPSFIVVYDDVVAPAATRIDFCMNSARFGGWNASYAPPKRHITVSGGTIAIGNALRTLVVEPEAFEYSITPYLGGVYHTFDILQLHRPTDAAVQKFLTVHYLGTNILPTENIKIGNCQGVIVDVGVERYLTLFSSDGQPVDEYIELGGEYAAADGGVYAFENTGVRTQFFPYQVMVLKPAPVVGKLLLSVSVVGTGTTEPETGTYQLAENTPVTVTATPAPGHRFVQWGGDVFGAEPSVSFNMTIDMNVVAFFEKIPIQRASLAFIAGLVTLGVIMPIAIIAIRRRK